METQSHIFILDLFLTNDVGPCNLVQEARATETGQEAEIRESTLSVHTCFLIKNLSSRDEHIRDISLNLLTRLRDRFPQVKVHCLLSGFLLLHLLK